MNGQVAIATAFTTLTNLNVALAGKYVIWAKMYMTGADTIVTCRLVAGSDVDESKVRGSTSEPAELTLNVAHEFAAAGTADLQCMGAAPGANANFTKISAIRVGNLASTT